MKTIQSLVEEAYEKYKQLQTVDYHKNLKVILTSLAEQASENGLKPLPEEMPAFVHDLFTDLLHNRLQPSAFYESIRKTYGTPPAEWWHGLRNGDKFKDGEGCVWTYNGEYSCIHGNYFLYTIEEKEIGLNADYCSPYTDPTDTFRSKLTPELQAEFDKVMKEVGK